MRRRKKTPTGDLCAGMLLLMSVIAPCSGALLMAFSIGRVIDFPRVASAILMGSFVVLLPLYYLVRACGAVIDRCETT